MRTAALRLAYANAIIAGSAAGWAAMTLVLARVPVGAGAVLLPYVIAFAVYTIDKAVLLDPVSDGANDPARTSFLVRWRAALIAAAAGGMALGAWASGRQSLLCLTLFLLPIPVGLLYAIRILPAGWRYRRIKDVTGGKSAAVALTWGVMAGLLPLIYTGAGDDGAALVAYAYVALRMFVNTVFFDVGDLAGDRAAGTITIPVRFGLVATRRMLHAVNLGSGAVLAGGAWWCGLSAIAYPVAAFAVGYGFLYLRVARSEGVDLGFTCDVIADGEGVATAAVVALAVTLLPAA
jgi:4-hydroxybenzoate polyprenyltransferase